MDCDLDVIGFKELKYDEICPIPITPEILEKNEFIKKEHRWTKNFYYEENYSRDAPNLP